MKFETNSFYWFNFLKKRKLKQDTHTKNTREAEQHSFVTWMIKINETPLKKLHTFSADSEPPVEFWITSGSLGNESRSPSDFTFVQVFITRQKHENVIYLFIHSFIHSFRKHCNKKNGKVWGFFIIILIMFPIALIILRQRLSLVLCFCQVMKILVQACLF